MGNPVLGFGYPGETRPKFIAGSPAPFRIKVVKSYLEEEQTGEINSGEQSSEDPKQFTAYFNTSEVQLEQ